MPNVGWHPDPSRTPKWRASYAAYLASRESLIPERFWAKVAKGDACWEWRGTKSTRGYGRFYYRGRVVQAHRLAWELTKGQTFPEGMDACHHCDNRGCVRPDHIFPGTPSMNALDAEAKGRLIHHGNAVRTHCKHGHEFTQDNTWYHPYQKTGRLHRRCRTCHRRLMAERRLRLEVLP